MDTKRELARKNSQTGLFRLKYTIIVLVSVFSECSDDVPVKPITDNEN